MTNKARWQGRFEIYINGQLEAVIDNRVMDAALDKLINSLTGVDPDLEIKYLALGTDNTAVTDSDTTLGTEIFRTAPTTGPSNTDTGEVTSEFVVLDSEAVATIEEIGIFAGSTATAAADSGTLVSRILWNKVKTNTMEINFKRVDKIIRG